MGLKQKDLEDVPLAKWQNLFKQCFNIQLLGIDSFVIGKDADNGFLEIDCFCERLNQTSADVSERQYRIFILNEGYVVKKKVSVTLSTEVEVNESLTEAEVMKIAFPEVGFNSTLYAKAVKTVIETK